MCEWYACGVGIPVGGLSRGDHVRQASLPDLVTIVGLDDGEADVMRVLFAYITEAVYLVIFFYYHGHMYSGP